MESNYALYIKEREGRDIIEDEKGFASYLITGEQCYIVDVFIKKEHRRQGIPNKYFKQIEDIAREKGCTYLLGSACIKAPNINESMKWLLSIGYSLSSISGDMIFLTKEL